MKSVEIQHYTDGLRTSRIICHDAVVDEAICSLISDVVDDWYRSMDHSMNPAFIPVARDLVSTLRKGYDRSSIFAWVSRHRAWMPSLTIVDVGPCEVAPRQVERLVALAEEIVLHLA